MKKPLRGQGFTLLELMIASALIAVVGLAVVTVFGRGFTAWRRSDARLQELFAVEKGFRTLGKELRNAVVLADGPFEGSKGEMKFFVSEDPVHLARVRYRVLPEGTLVRESQPFPSGKDAPFQPKNLISKVAAFSIEYGFPKKTDDGRTLIAWQEAWAVTQQAQLPTIVRVHIAAEDSQGKISIYNREFWIPHEGLQSIPIE